MNVLQKDITKSLFGNDKARVDLANKFYRAIVELNEKYSIKETVLDALQQNFQKPEIYLTQILFIHLVDAVFENIYEKVDEYGVLYYIEKLGFLKEEHFKLLKENMNPKRREILLIAMYNAIHEVFGAQYTNLDQLEIHPIVRSFVSLKTPKQDVINGFVVTILENSTRFKKKVKANVFYIKNKELKK